MPTLLILLIEPLGIEICNKPTKEVHDHYTFN